MESLLRVKLLGGFEFLLDQRSIPELHTPRLKSLITYLLLNPKRPVSRQQLAYLFWPDTTDEQARTNLRHLLHSLRLAVPVLQQFMSFDRQNLQWRPEVNMQVDVFDFERLAAQVDSIQALQAAVDLYSGDLLPDLYDDWVLAERERWRQLYLGSLERLATLLENEGDYQAAIPYARSLLEQDPLQESIYRLLMRLHTLNGDRAGALRVYHACVAALRRELNVEPSQATVLAYRQLLDAEEIALPEKAAGARAIPLVGRKEEWGVIQVAWREARRGQPHLILISGEAGIGKSRLAEEMVQWTSRQGIPTREAHCFAVQGELAFAPLAAWLRQHSLPDLDPVWAVELARLLPELRAKYPALTEAGPTGDQWQRLRLFEACARALLKGKHTLLLYLDDLQWCDQHSLDWLQFLFNLPALQPDLIKGCKVFGICTVRSEERLQNNGLLRLLTALQGKDQLTEIELNALDEKESSLLAAHVAERSLSADEAAGLYRETEGNPLFLVETVRSGLSRDLPSKVQAVIAARLAQASPSAHQILNLAAVIGRQFAFPVLMKASDQEEMALVEGLDELWRLRIIRERGLLEYDFSHDKLREVAYEALSTAQRRHLHRRVAQSLEYVFQQQIEGFGGQIAGHFEAAGMAQQALKYTLLVAEAARLVYANLEAVQTYQKAIRLFASLDEKEHDYESERRAYEYLGDLLALMREYEAARQAYQEAIASLQHSQPLLKASLERKIANAWRDQDGYEQARTGYYSALASLGDEPGEGLREWWQEWIQIQADHMMLYYWINDVSQLQVLSQSLEEPVSKYGSDKQQAEFYAALVHWYLRRDRMRVSDETLECSRKRLALYRQSGSPAEILFNQFGHGFCLLWHADYAEAEEVLQASLAQAEEYGDLTLQARCLTYLTILYRLCNQVEQVRDYARRSLALCQKAGMKDYLFSALANQAWAALSQSPLPEAEAQFNHAIDYLNENQIFYSFEWVGRLPMVYIRLKQQQVGEAIEHTRRILNPRLCRLPEKLEEPLEEAVKAWESDLPDEAQSLLHHAIQQAIKIGYL